MKNSLEKKVFVIIFILKQLHEREYEGYRERQNDNHCNKYHNDQQRPDDYLVLFCFLCHDFGANRMNCRFNHRRTVIIGTESGYKGMEYQKTKRDDEYHQQDRRVELVGQGLDCYGRIKKQVPEIENGESENCRCVLAIFYQQKCK